jgi:S1-C subfamily serine protease
VEYGRNQLKSEYLDLVLIGFGIYVTFAGWRRGLIVSIFSFFGLFVGAWLGRSFISIFAGASQETSITKTGISVAILLAGMGLGSALGGFIGYRVKDFFKWGFIRAIDSAAGAILSITVWTVVAWFTATTLLAAPANSFTNVLADSKVVSRLDEVMPVQIRSGIESIRIYVSDSHLPSGLTQVLLSPPVDAPDETAIDAPAVVAALDSVVKVEGSAVKCSTRLTGSGFVVGQDLILTNAHVVAGVTEPTVRIKGKGKAFSGVIVYFDPNRDIALIRTNGIPATQLRISDELPRGTSTVVAGFPGGGPLMLIPARVRGVSTSSGTDIYGKAAVRREIYSIRANIKQGDSGAPMFAMDGTVAGLIFASSANDPTTGYALTSKEFMSGVDQAGAATQAVSTGECSGV